MIEKTRNNMTNKSIVRLVKILYLIQIKHEVAKQVQRPFKKIKEKKEKEEDEDIVLHGGGVPIAGPIFLLIKPPLHSLGGAGLSTVD